MTTDTPSPFRSVSAPPAPTFEAYHCVEFHPPSLGACYQFRLWHLDRFGPCLMVGAGSRVLGHLRVGDTLAMKYYPSERSRPHVVIPTRIGRINPPVEGRFRGHVLVGLSAPGDPLQEPVPAARVRPGRAAALGAGAI